MTLHKLVRPEIYKGGKRPSFAAAYARAARRYGFDTGRNAGFAKRNNVVVKVKGKHDKDTDHEVPAESIQNGRPWLLEYVVPVKIGTPGVSLNLDFDTGSSDLWVWSSELARASRYKGHTIYDPSKSSTAKKTSGSWNISYGDGSSASGNVYTDNVTVADITIPGQAVELAEKLSPSFLQDGGNDGLLGLAWPQINTVQPKAVATPVENLISKKLIDPPVFTVKLGRGEEAGFYSFGFIDTSVTPNPITYTPVDNSQGFWQVESASWSLNGDTKERSGNTTILDTGTTLLLVSDEVVDAFYGAIDGAVFDDQQGGYKFPTNATIPDISFAVGNTLYKVNPKDIAFGDAGDGFTFGGIQSRGDMDFDIFGDVFLKSVYAVFNQGEKTVGLAQRDD
ncbi:acid protease [Trametes maxima]|nr:acid protease [Trametes maxima]